MDVMGLGRVECSILAQAKCRQCPKLANPTTRWQKSNCSSTVPQKIWRSLILSDLSLSTIRRTVDEEIILQRFPMHLSRMLDIYLWQSRWLYSYSAWQKHCEWLTYVPIPRSSRISTPKCSHCWPVCSSQRRKAQMKNWTSEESPQASYQHCLATNSPGKTSQALTQFRMTSAASLIPSLQDLCANSTHSWLCSRMTRIFCYRSSSTTTSARWTGRKGPRTKAKLHFLRFIQHCLRVCLFPGRSTASLKFRADRSGASLGYPKRAMAWWLAGHRGFWSQHCFPKQPWGLFLHGECQKCH